MPSQAKGMRYKQLLSKAIPYAGGTNSCFLNKLPTRSTKSCLLNQLPTLVVQPYAGGTDAADLYSITLRKVMITDYY